MAASMPQYPLCFSSSRTHSIKLVHSISRTCNFKLPKSSSSSSSSSSSLEPESENTDPVKIAFEKAKAYKKAIQSNNPVPKIIPNPVLESSQSGLKNDGSGLKFVSYGDNPVLESYQDAIFSDPFAEGVLTEVEKGDASKFAEATTSKQPILQEDSGIDKLKDSMGPPEPVYNDPMKLAFAKAQAYKEIEESYNESFRISWDQVRESSERLLNKEGLVSEYTDDEDTLDFADLLKQMAEKGRKDIADNMISGEDMPEVEIVGDASKVEEAAASELNTRLEENLGQYEPKFASWNNPSSATTFEKESDFPEVEIIVGDASKFVRSKPRVTLEEESGLYKPKLSSEDKLVDNNPATFAFEEARSYKEDVQSHNPTPKISPDQERQSSEKRMIKEGSVLGHSNNGDTPSFADLLKQMANESGDDDGTDDIISGLFQGDDFPEEEEMIAGDASELEQAITTELNGILSEDSGKYAPKFTSWESSSSAATLENVSDFPEVEIIVGDTSKFKRSKPRITLEEESGLYKPKVSSKPVSVDNDPVNLASAKGSEYKNVFESSTFGQAVASEPNKTLKEESAPYEPKVISWANPSTATMSENGSEIIVGDASKFQRSKPRITLEEESGLYKPKVSSKSVPVHNDPGRIANKEVVLSKNSTPQTSSDQVREYPERWMNIYESVLENTHKRDTPTFADLLKQMSKRRVGNNTDAMISEPLQEQDFPEVEMVLGDPSKFGQVTESKADTMLKEDSGEYKPKVTSWGNSHSENTIGNESDFPEVEIIVGDTSKFARSKPRITLEEESGLYKPKLSSEPAPVVQSYNPTPKISPDQVQQSSESRMNIELSVSEYNSNEDTLSFADLLNQMAKQRKNKTDGTISESFPEEDFSETDIIVGDPNKLGQTAASEHNTMFEEDSEQYKTKVTSLSSPLGTSSDF